MAQKVSLPTMNNSVKQSPKMRYFSRLAGSYTKLTAGADYRVQFKNILWNDNHLYRNWTRLISLGTLSAAILFGLILFEPKYWIITQQPESSLYSANLLMLICLFLLQIFAIILTITAARSTLIARNPIPVISELHHRVAFATTRAPGEPIEMVRTTLQAATKIRNAGSDVDVWLLDETANETLRSICQELGVYYFTRAGIAHWNTPKYESANLAMLGSYALWAITFGRIRKLPRPVKPDPFMATKSKHGNFNSWREHLAHEGIHYDILAGVDTDQVPEPNFLERLLGYFQDKDVAYVVGPQVYANYGPGLSRLVSRLAESQASFFQSTVQRAGNYSTSPMFVGTNYAVRMNVLNQINGFQPCITEDMATGLAIHTNRNPETGNRWKSVYTPDVLALGEGPDVWGTFFTQQWRWAAGTFDTWRKVVWKKFHKLSPGAMLHYFLMLTYYPIAAVTWILSVLSSMIYLVTGATAILAPWDRFVSLYFTVLVMQLSLYFWNRRFNVSPHEPAGSYGVAGMIASTLMAPIYFSALMGILLGKKPHFVVTKKGTSNSFDRISAFYTHLRWAGVLVAGIVVGFIRGHDHPAMLVWAGLLLVVCLSPVVLGMALPIKHALKKLNFGFQNSAKLSEEGNINA